TLTQQLLPSLASFKLTAKLCRHLEDTHALKVTLPTGPDNIVLYHTKQKLLQLVLDMEHNTIGAADDYIDPLKWLVGMNTLAASQFAQYQAQLHLCFQSKDYLALEDLWHTYLPKVNILKQIDPAIAYSDYPFSTYQIKAFYIEHCWQDAVQNNTTVDLNT